MIPFILAGVGAYLVGSGLMKKSTKSYKDGGYMAKGGSVKPLSYYVYETAKITINWRGKTQPYGRFKSAVDALNQIKKIARTNSELSEYSIVTPDGTLNVSEYMASGGYMAKGGLASVKKKYEENEDENAHSENVVLLAKHFGTKEDLAKAKEILALHEKEGSLSSENGKKRQELHLKLIEKARKEMSKEGISFAKGGYMAKGGKLKVGGDDFSFLLELSDKELSKRLDLVREQQAINSNQYFETREKGNSTNSIEESGKKLQNEETAIIQARMKKMADGGMMAKGGDTEGKNGYVAFYKGKRIEVYADTMYEAQLKAAKIFNAKKSYDVNVVLAEVGGEQYVNSTMASGGKMAKGGEVDEVYFMVKPSFVKELTEKAEKEGVNLEFIETNDGKEVYRAEISDSQLKEYAKLPLQYKFDYAKGGVTTDTAYKRRIKKWGFQPYGKTKGKFKVTYEADGEQYVNSTMASGGYMAKGGKK